MEQRKRFSIALYDARQCQSAKKEEIRISKKLEVLSAQKSICQQLLQKQLVRDGIISKKGEEATPPAAQREGGVKGFVGQDCVEKVSSASKEEKVLVPEGPMCFWPR